MSDHDETLKACLLDAVNQLGRVSDELVTLAEKLKRVVAVVHEGEAPREPYVPQWDEANPNNLDPRVEVVSAALSQSLTLIPAVVKLATALGSANDFSGDFKLMMGNAFIDDLAAVIDEEGLPTITYIGGVQFWSAVNDELYNN